MNDDIISIKRLTFGSHEVHQLKIKYESGSETLIAFDSHLSTVDAIKLQMPEFMKDHTTPVKFDYYEINEIDVYHNNNSNDGEIIEEPILSPEDRKERTEYDYHVRTYWSLFGGIKGQGRDSLLDRPTLKELLTDTSQLGIKESDISIEDFRPDETEEKPTQEQIEQQDCNNCLRLVSSWQKRKANKASVFIERMPCDLLEVDKGEEDIYLCTDCSQHVEDLQK